MGVVEFTVFGPLQAIRDGRPVRLGGPKPRALLAALLLGDGRRVPVDSLVELLWPDAAPSGQVKAVQKYVSLLRQQLGGAGLIVSRPRGYEIHAQAVDTHRFERLVEEAEATGDPAAACARLDGALALWRGDPYLDLDDLPAAIVERRRLEERRVAAIEALAEARLALGHHRQLVAWLEEQVAGQPLSERLWGQLMIALYRCGRQAEALAAYRRLRTTLVEELGVEPAPDLQRLLQRILDQDGSLAWYDPGGSRSQPATRRATGTGTGTLPRQLTGFVGRDAELAELRELVEVHRAVTLIGGPGHGKTRLAVELAAQLAGRYRDGARLVELAPSSSADQVPLAVASCFGIGEPHGRPLAEAVADHLRDKHVLLVLDNAEHLVDPVAELVDRLLRAASEIRVLTTSRQPLGVGGEAIFDLAPLPIPPGDQLAGIDAYDSVRLLVERASTADPRFSLSSRNAAGVARICRRLDGIPLALELAAARLRAFEPDQLADLLDDRFEVLVSTIRRAPPRHQTLRAAIAWSYDLLTAAEQLLFRRLSVFDGGFTLDAVERVCATEPLGRAVLVDQLPSLVDRSLVAVDRRGPEATRYRLLETPRQYGRTLLSDGQRRELSAGHLGYFVDLAEQAEAGLRGPAQQQWLQRLDAERSNLRAALRWSLAGDEPAHRSGVRLLGALRRYWDLRDLFSEARAWVDAALPAPAGTTPRTRAGMLAASAGVALWQADHAAAAVQARQSLELFDQVGDALGAADARYILGRARLHEGDYLRAAELLERCRGELERLGETWHQARALGRLGQLARLRGEHALARAHLQAARTLHDRTGDHRLACWTTWQLGMLACYEGDYQQAIELCEASLATYQGQPDADGVAHVRYTLGDIAAAQGDDSRAAQLYEQSLATLRELGDRRCVASTLSNLGAVAVRAGRAGRAAQLLDESLFIRRQVGDQAGVAECAERLADLRLLEGDPAGAARLAGSAGALRERSGAGRPAAGEAANRDRLRALRATLEVDVLGRAWQAGRAGADTFLHGGATS